MRREVWTCDGCARPPRADEASGYRYDGEHFPASFPLNWWRLEARQHGPGEVRELHLCPECAAQPRTLVAASRKVVGL